MKTQKGFTLVEMVIVVLIASILIAIAIPSFNSMIRAIRLNTITNEIVGALLFARSKSITTDEPVFIVPEDTWSNGFFIAKTTKTKFSSNVVMVHDALPSNYQLTVKHQSSNEVSDYIQYNPNGAIEFAVGLILCETEFGDVPTEGHIKAIEMSYIGRVSMAKDKNDNGIPEFMNPLTGLYEDITSCK